jgi:hypothetical protein
MTKIKNFDNFINENVYVDAFKILYDKAPDDLQEIIDATKIINQSEKWHPEGNVFKHTRIVTNRLANCYNDINLTLSGIFHDLGKIKTTNWDDEKESWTAHGHENESSKIANNFKDWIYDMGGNIKVIDFIILNHMRIKYLDEFRFQEKMKFLNEPLFEYVRKFESADYGGTDLECKELRDMTNIELELTKFNKEQKENRIISSKFNGKIIMDLYPDLRGKELGNAITGFKNHIGDFREYALKNPKGQIVKDFINFYEK